MSNPHLLILVNRFNRNAEVLFSEKIPNHLTQVSDHDHYLAYAKLPEVLDRALEKGRSLDLYQRLGQGLGYRPHASPLPGRWYQPNKTMIYP